PLRYLNKTELLEIILEQERIINEQIAKAQRIEEELAKREIILGQSGSIAEAATKISGIFEAAQDAADRYLESVIAANGSERTEPTEE
ncbi:MAG TPA: DNA repair protein, partial [Clostridiales bacterium]|nr:DNA repair protein [Clostridiales bacterium]